MKYVRFSRQAHEEYLDWQQSDERTFEKINVLIKNILRDPFKGLGKPEPLKGNLKGNWSRRISQEHRLIYSIDNENVTIHSCHGHYDD